MNLQLNRFAEAIFIFVKFFIFVTFYNKTCHFFILWLLVWMEIKNKLLMRFEFVSSIFESLIRTAATEPNEQMSFKFNYTPAFFFIQLAMLYCFLYIEIVDIISLNCPNFLYESLSLLVFFFFCLFQHSGNLTFCKWKLHCSSFT